MAAVDARTIHGTAMATTLSLLWTESDRQSSRGGVDTAEGDVLTVVVLGGPKLDGTARTASPIRI